MRVGERAESRNQPEARERRGACIYAESAHWRENPARRSGVSSCVHRIHAGLRRALEWLFMVATHGSNEIKDSIFLTLSCFQVRERVRGKPSSSCDKSGSMVWQAATLRSQPVLKSCSVTPKTSGVLAHHHRHKVLLPSKP